ncbi:MAG: two-component sensor histidine kinase [Hespellia sp.]|nr:two-component sensor histidine kinase [Hespellia sp.]
MVIISRGKLKIKNKFFRSLRFRIALLVIAAWILPVIVLIVGILKSYEARAVSLRTAEIQNQCTILSNHLNTYQYLNDPSSEVINSELAQLTNIYNGRVMIVDKNLTIIKDTYNLDEGKTMVAEGVIQCYKGNATSSYDKRNRYIEVTAPIMEVNSGKVNGVLLISVSTDTIADTVDVLQARGTAIFGIATILVIILAFGGATLMVNPFRKVTKTLSEVSEGYGEEEFQENKYTETEAMSDALNKMLGRLKVLDDTRQEFVSNVSHELKTPLASMKVLADSLLAQEEVPNELYRDFMQDITEEIERENDIITDLLSLVKMDRTSPNLNIQPVNVNELLELILKRLKPLAVEKNIELVLESFRPVTAEIDEVKMTLAFTNLVENAIKYNQPGGFVHVTLNADHKYFYVKVADSGIGIPQEDQSHIFERFYRVDKSHSREVGGTGLGLAITRSAVIMHRGSIKVYSSEGDGTTFTVRTPLSYIL